MKKLIFAIVAFAGVNMTATAQAIPAKKTTAPKMEVVKTTKVKKTDAKVVAISKPAPAVVTKTPAVKTKEKTVVVTKTAPAATKTVTVAKTSTGVILKKDGTPDKRYKTNSGNGAGPLKKDGTPDMRYKANKKP